MLDEVHRELDRTYNELHDLRRGPVYFIEHGLSEKEVAGLIAEVSQAMNAHPLESAWWHARHLPLIVVATEIGYRYRGTGTDFWPTLEGELGVHISATERKHIRDFFASATEIYRGAEPPETPWARAFNLIAWPITHALLPLEFHRPFALALAGLGVNIADLNDEGLHRAIRIVASRASARFSTLLADARLVVTVARGLLGDYSGEMCSDTLKRIKADLNADQAARRGVAVARRIQRTAARQPNHPTPPSALEPIAGALRIRRRNDAMSIEAMFPPLKADLQLKLRRALRRQRYAPRLWGLSERIPSEQFLSGVPFPIKLASAPPSDAALLPDIDQIDLEQDLREVLASFELNMTSPLLFSASSDGERAWRVQGPRISGHRQYWYLSDSRSGTAGSLILGKVGPYTCCLLNPAEESGLDALASLGFQVHFGFAVDFSGAPQLYRDSTVPVFAVGDRLHISPKRTPKEGLSIELIEEQVRLSDNYIASFVVENGDHTLRLSSIDEARDFAFCGTSSPRITPPSTCSIKLSSDDLSVQALLQGKLCFAVDSFAPLEGLELTVEIEAASRRFYASAPLDRVPCAIASAQEPFTTVLDDKTRGLLSQASSLVLRLSVGRLCTFEVSVERRVRPCWWVSGTDASLKLTSELGDLPFGEVTTAAPHLPPALGLSTQGQKATLLAPIGLDAVEFGGTAPFATYCKAPKTSCIEDPSVTKPRLRRRLRGEHGTVGVEDLVEAYLRWSLAETNNILAEFWRNQIAKEIDGWITEICCGSQWRDRELDIQQMSAWECLLETAHKLGLGKDAYVSLPDGVWYQVIDIATSQLRRELPELWELVRPPYDVGEQDWQIVESVFENAYKTISHEYQKRGDEKVSKMLSEADFTADNNPESWRAAFETVLAQHDLRALASLLYPTDTALGLVAITAAGLSLKELSHELENWVDKYRRALVASPSGAELYAILALWAEPEVTVYLDWREALNTLVADRGIARAARYLALRYRQQIQGS